MAFQFILFQRRGKCLSHSWLVLELRKIFIYIHLNSLCVRFVRPVIGSTFEAFCCSAQRIVNADSRAIKVSFTFSKGSYTYVPYPIRQELTKNRKKEETICENLSVQMKIM